jgi:hypothetical protein
MTQKKIHIVWADGRTIDIKMESNPAADYYYSCIKHLQHVDLKFDLRQNPLHVEQMSRQELKDNLLSLAKLVDLAVDPQQLDNQEYLNNLHAEYVTAVDRPVYNPAWFKVHSAIHILEPETLPRHSVWFDYEEKSGPLVKPFDREWLKYAVTEITPGMCSIREHELGKSLSVYKMNNEPLEIKTMCALSKPWLWFRPVLDVAYTYQDTYADFQEDEFNQWFAPFRKQWCQHWGIPDWHPREMTSAIPVGYTDDYAILAECFRKLDYPKRIRL